MSLIKTITVDNTQYDISDAEARSAIIANTGLISDTVGWSGKNQCKFNPYASVNGSVTPTIDRETQTISYSGNASAITWFGISEKATVKPASASADSILLKAGRYKLVTKQPDSSFNSNTYVAVISYTNGYILATVGGPFASNFTLSEDTYVYVGIRFASGYGNGTVVNAMVVDADILDDTYEPYRGTTAFPRDEQGILGAKNLLNNTAITQTLNGVTFTVNADKTVSTSGTSNAEWGRLNLNRFVIPKGDYILSGITGGISSTYRMGVQKHISGAIDDVLYDGELNLHFDTDTDISVYIIVRLANVNMDGKVFYPMVRLATDTDDTYQPYSMTNRELTEEVNALTVTDITNSYFGTMPTNVTKRSSTKIYTIGKLVVINAVIYKSDGFVSDTNVTIPISSNYSPIEYINSSCAFGTGEWVASQVGYVFVDKYSATTHNFIIKCPVSGMSYAKINLCYVMS